MQTSLDVVKAAIEFKGPDRLPRIFDAFADTDVRNAHWNQIGTGDHSLKLTYDEWNCGWSRSDVKNMGLVTIHPLTASRIHLPISIWNEKRSNSWLTELLTSI